MSTLRRFLVIQALLLLAGRVPVLRGGRRPHRDAACYGSFGQGMVTRHVTDWMNVIGAAAVAILAWDQWANGDRAGLPPCPVGPVGGPGRRAWRRSPSFTCGSSRTSTRRWTTATFYVWHRVYLFAAAAAVGAPGLLRRGHVAGVGEARGRAGFQPVQPIAGQLAVTQRRRTAALSCQARL